MESIIAKVAHFFAPDYAPQMSWGEWQQEQKADENIMKVIDLIEKGELREYHGEKMIILNSVIT